MVAIVSGVPGQGAHYLISLLLEKGYSVIGTYRYSSTSLGERLERYPKESEALEYRCLDIADSSGVSALVYEVQPDEVYNLAAASHVHQSFKNPYSVFDVNTIGVLNWLEAIRAHHPSARFFQASTSELFGSQFSVDKDGAKYQDENTPMVPNSPYAAAKLAAHNLVRIYRKSYNLHACCGIMFNYESSMRGCEFVTRKITRWIGKFEKWRKEQIATACPKPIRFTTNDDFDIHAVNEYNQPVSNFPKLRLGNVQAIRDWSHASDMVRGMYLMLQQDEPDDYVLCGGHGHSILDFMREAFGCIGVEDFSSCWVTDPEFYRPCEVEYLQGRYSKARDKLDWKPEIGFSSLVKEMVNYDTA